jgi:signal transduction histidine kinase
LSKFYLRAILDLSPDGFVSFDADRRVKYANPAFTRMTHIRLDQIIDRDEQVLAELLASQCSAGCPALAFEAMHQCSGIPRRHLLELSHGVCRNLEVMLQQSDVGAVSQILYLRDISHETAVDRMKSEFLTTAAHELRTPMASIYGYAELLATQELDPTSRTEFTGILFRHARGMVAVLDDLLDMARIEARRSLDFVFETISAHELLQDAAGEFRLPLGRLAPTLKLPLEPLHVLADRQKLLQVIQNVLSNAYKYSPQGSSVAIELLPSTSLANTAPQVGIRITDHGIGMTPEQQSRVFERFYRADTSGKTLGTGLGMSIVHEIVTLHGGTVELRCSLGMGTSVTLWLPA